jgi:16S rRNA (adenine1518-N6/adenine1519-N6)-dimethyltransferase
MKRLTAKPGNKNYGRLAVIAQSFSEPVYLMKIPAHKFVPKPEVDAGLVRLTLKTNEGIYF